MLGRPVGTCCQFQGGDRPLASWISEPRAVQTPPGLRGLRLEAISEKSWVFFFLFSTQNCAEN